MGRAERYPPSLMPTFHRGVARGPPAELPLAQAAARTTFWPTSPQVSGDSGLFVGPS